MKDFSEQLRKILQKRNISQTELCEKTGIPKSAISQYLSGAFRPKQERTYLLAKALNTTPEYLMGLTDDPEIPTSDWTIIPEINDGYPVPTPLKDMLVAEHIQKMEASNPSIDNNGEQSVYMKKIVGKIAPLSEEEQKKAWEVLKAIFSDSDEQ